MADNDSKNTESAKAKSTTDTTMKDKRKFKYVGPPQAGHIVLPNGKKISTKEFTDEIIERQMKECKEVIERHFKRT